MSEICQNELSELFAKSNAAQNPGSRIQELESQLAEAKALLKDLEWDGCDLCDGDSVCPVCQVRPDYDLATGTSSGKHAPDCRLAKVIGE